MYTLLSKEEIRTVIEDNIQRLEFLDAKSDFKSPEEKPIAIWAKHHFGGRIPKKKVLSLINIDYPKGNNYT